MEPDEVAGSLTRFGLSKRESLLYLASLRRGRATARELTRDAGIDRVLGYRLLDGLRARGVLEATAERPRRYAPVSPDILLDRNLRGRRGALAEDELVAKDLATMLQRVPPATAQGGARYQLLTGTSNIHDYLQEMVERARLKLEVMLTFRSMRDSLAHGLGVSVAEFLRRGGAVRLILESHAQLPPTLARLERTTKKYEDAEIRVSDPQPSRLTIADGSEALLFLVPEARDRGSDHVAVWTDHPGFVRGQQVFFARAWKAARVTVDYRK